MASGTSAKPSGLDHDGFLSALRDRLRDEGDTSVILAETTERLAHHFSANRTGYGEVDDAGETFFPRNHWVDGTVVSIDRPLPFSVFGDRITGGLKRGETWTHESLDDPALDDAGREICRELGIAAAITVPLMKSGRFVALLSVQHSTPHRWTPADVALVHEVADRTWATLERARAEEARSKSEAVLAAIMRHAPIGIYLKDEFGRFETANEEMARLMGQPVGVIAGRTATELLDPEQAAAVTRADEEAMRNGTPVMREVAYPDRHDHERSLTLRVPIDADDGRTRHLAGFEIDITELKRTQAELERSREALYQSEKINALGALLAGVSHELNNPLSIIVAQAELLGMEALAPSAAARAAKISRAAQRSARIVQTFLAMARQKRPDRGRVDLNDVVRAALELFGYGLRSSGIVVREALMPDLPSLLADADQLHQVVVNLLVNAQQAMQDCPGERVLTLTTDRDQASRTVHLTVSDTGPGIPADLRRRIFDPFFTTKTKSSGTGIGLSFSQGIVEAHGGSLAVVESAGGATFRIVLPTNPDAEAPPEDTATDDAPSIGGGYRSALVVDDEPQVAETLADILQRLGFATTTASSGVAAKSAIGEKPFDVVISDLRMPDVDGPALFAWLGIAHPALASRVAFYTGDTLSPAAAEFLREAGRPFMEKPFTVASVRRLIDALERDD